MTTQSEGPSDNEVIERFNALVLADKKVWAKKFRDMRAELMEAGKSPLYAGGMPMQLANVIQQLDQNAQQLDPQT